MAFEPLPSLFSSYSAPDRFQNLGKIDTVAHPDSADLLSPDWYAMPTHATGSTSPATCMTRCKLHPGASGKQQTCRRAGSLDQSGVVITPLARRPSDETGLPSGIRVSEEHDFVRARDRIERFQLVCCNRYSRTTCG